MRGEDTSSPSTPRTVAQEEEGWQEEEEGLEFKMPAETEEEFLLNDNQLADPRTRRLVRNKLLKEFVRVPSDGFLRMALFKLIKHQVVEAITWGGGNGTTGMKESNHHVLMEGNSCTILLLCICDSSLG